MYNCLRENQQVVNLARDKENEAEAKKSLQNAMSNVSPFVNDRFLIFSLFSYDSSETNRPPTRLLLNKRIKLFTSDAEKL
jgi:hypothetical protein